MADARTPRGGVVAYAEVSSPRSAPVAPAALSHASPETVTGQFALASSSRGTPPRSIFWIEQDGTEHLLSTPGLGTPSGIDVRPNPERFGAGTAGVNDWDWMLQPNPGGLPEVGNAAFSLTVATNGTTAPTYTLATVCAGMLTTPQQLLGADVWVDLTTLLHSVSLAPGFSSTLALPIPNDTSLPGVSVFVQTFHLEGAAFRFSTSPGLGMTIL